MDGSSSDVEILPFKPASRPIASTSNTRSFAEDFYASAHGGKGFHSSDTGWEAVYAAKEDAAGALVRGERKGKGRVEIELSDDEDFAEPEEDEKDQEKMHKPLFEEDDEEPPDLATLAARNPLTAKKAPLRPSPAIASTSKAKSKSTKEQELLDDEMENGIRPKARKRAAPDASDIARKAAARAREAEELEEYEMENGVRPTKKKRKAAPVEEESDTENQSIAMRATNKKKDVEDSAPKKKKASPIKRTQLAEDKADQKAEKDRLKRQDSAAKLANRTVNTLKLDRKETIAEIVVHIDGTSFSIGDDESSKKGKGRAKKSPWLSIAEEVKEAIVTAGGKVEFASGEDKDNLGSLGAVKWTRVCDKRWNMETERFDPLMPGKEITVEEDSRLIFMTGIEISQHVADKTLLKHLRTIKSSIPPLVSLYIIIHGLEAIFSALKNNANAEHAHQVRLATNGEDEGYKEKKVGIGEDQPGRNEIELELLRVEAALRCFYIYTEKEAEAVQWLLNISMDVGAKPYQRLKMSHFVTLGGSSDKLPIGKAGDHEDTYLKMISSIKGITPANAKGISARFPTLRSLYEGYRGCAGEKEKKEMLVGAEKANNVNGTASKSKLGLATSTKLYQIMCGTDKDALLG